MKKIVKCAACIMIVAVLVLALYMNAQLPDSYSVVAGEEITIRYPALAMKYKSQSTEPQVYASPGNSYRMDLKLLGAIQVKTVEVNVVNRKMVQVCGTPFGIKMFTDGLMIVGMSDIPYQGGRVNPARDSGLKVGDILEKINGVKLVTNEQFGKIVEDSGGQPLQVQARRNNRMFSAVLKPVKSGGDEKYRVGVWVRDSSAGIGTMTYYDPNSGLFTGLGHAVCDVDTGDIMPLANGQIVDAEITGYKKGVAGTPGELKGKFSEGAPIGELLANTSTGVYGNSKAVFSHSGVLMPVAMGYEVETGKATILTTINGKTPQEYEIEIEKVLVGENGKGQNLVIHVTDKTLLEKTGGIVQGMSGSPIIQNGMLVGSVTHVFVNDPTRGFGIFAENIQNNAKTAVPIVHNAS